jgi:ribosomal protein S18 acetylase RimI-like enzyme
MKTISLDDPRDFLVYRQGSGDTVEVYDIQICSERRHGKGRALINKLINEKLPFGTRLVWAITRADNIIAKQFYESMRFRIVANLWNFYQDTALAITVDAIMYGRDVHV